METSNARRALSVSVTVALALGFATAGCGGSDGATGGDGTGGASTTSSGGSSSSSANSGGCHGCDGGGGGDGGGSATNGGATSGGGGKVARSGVYAEWYGSHEPNLPYVVGGQLEVNWSDLVDPDGTINFDAIDTPLSQMTQPTTLQVNGGKKPPQIYGKVPYAVLASSKNDAGCPHSPWTDSEANDYIQIKGSSAKCLVTPMYWHPTFISEYVALIKAVADHLHQTDVGKVVALRQNWNAIGTEHLKVPNGYEDPMASGWIWPSSNLPQATTWSSSVQTTYETRILDAHIQRFQVGGVMVPPVFVRTSLESEVLNSDVTGSPGMKYSDYFRTGVLGWFMTGAEMEPRPGGGGGYSVFKDYCATGETLALSESWADAWGNHTSKTDVHWATPPQFNYWRLLSDLQLGISYEDVYGNDLDIAVNGAYNGQSTPYESEFDAAFKFATKYLGYAAQPDKSPGAWIAFRPADAAVHDYDVADYAEFISLLNPSATTGLDARTDGDAVPMLSMPDGIASDHYFSIGPYQQRFGSWARKIAQGASAELKLDAAFEAHENAQPKKLVFVIYLDDKSGSKLTITAGGQSKQVTLAGSGKWLTAELQTSGALTPNGSGANVVITANHGAIVLHLVEVTY